MSKPDLSLKTIDALLHKLDTAYNDTANQVFLDAAAMIEVLRERAVPEVPNGWIVNEIESRTGIDGLYYRASIMPESDIGTFERVVYGDGKTIPGAIDAAIRAIEDVKP